MLPKTTIFTVLLLLVLQLKVVPGQNYPPPPALISPATGVFMDNGCMDRSDGIEWDFEWEAVPNAKKYHLYVKSRSASIPVVDNKGLAKTVYKHRKPKTYIGGRGPSIWSWRVRAFVGKNWTEWSEDRIFAIEPLDTDCK